MWMKTAPPRWRYILLWTKRELKCKEKIGKFYAKVICKRCISTAAYNSTHNSLQAYLSLRRCTAVTQYSLYLQHGGGDYCRRNDDGTVTQRIKSCAAMLHTQTRTGVVTQTQMMCFCPRLSVECCHRCGGQLPCSGDSSLQTIWGPRPPLGSVVVARVADPGFFQKAQSQASGEQKFLQWGSLWVQNFMQVRNAHIECALWRAALPKVPKIFGELCIRLVIENLRWHSQITT